MMQLPLTSCDLVLADPHSSGPTEESLVMTGRQRTDSQWFPVFGRRARWLRPAEGMQGLSLQYAVQIMLLLLFRSFAPVMLCIVL